MTDRATLPLPVVTIYTEDVRDIQRVVAVEIDGERVPRTTSVSVKDAASDVSRVTIEFLAGRVIRAPYEEPVAFERCPVCDSGALARLVDGWQDGRPIKVVGCGNPWHYATASLSDLTSVSPAVVRASSDQVDDSDDQREPDTETADVP